MRSTSPADDGDLVRLLDEAYLDTIDDDPETDHAAELDTWRHQDGADDDASSLAVEHDRLIAACLIGRELGAPFLYDIVVLAARRHQGIGRSLLERSLTVLTDRSEPHIAAWVTHGNAPSEALLAGLGFLPVTPPVHTPVALGYYRAAAAVGHAEVPPEAPLAATVERHGPVLWVIDGNRPEASVVVRETTIRVRHLAADAPEVHDLAERAMPLRSAAWFLGRRADLRHQS